MKIIDVSISDFFIRGYLKVSGNVILDLNARMDLPTHEWEITSILRGDVADIFRDKIERIKRKSSNEIACSMIEFIAYEFKDYG